MHRFSTQPVADGERVDAFEDFNAGSFYRMSYAIEADAARRFAADIALLPAASGILVECAVTGHVARRTAANIDNDSARALFLYEELGAGSYFQRADGSRLTLRPGELLIGHADRVFETAPIPGHDFRMRILTVPLDVLEPDIERRMSHAPQRVDCSAGVNALLAATFGAFCREAARMTPQQREASLRALAQLLAVSEGLIPAAAPSGRAAVAAARLEAARRYIRAHLHQPTLDQTRVARAIGVSLRQLHLLFEPGGVSVGRYITRQRMARAKALLTDGTARTVTDVAFQCGYDNLATFYRCFRQCFGMTPSLMKRGEGTMDDEAGQEYGSGSGRRASGDGHPATGIPIAEKVFPVDRKRV